MKKLAKKTYIVTFIIVSILLLIVGTLSVKAAETVTYDATEWQTFNRTKEEIGKEYSKAMGYNTTYRDGVSSTYYKIPASTENPYEPGELTQDTHTVMTNMVNYYRWLIGANPLTVVSQHSHSLQAGALVRNFQFDHQVKDEKKPDDMDYDLWNEGAHCGHNIIAMNYTPRGAITGWINEGYSLTYNKFDTLGHRSALIASKFKNVQFGYAGSVAIGVDDNSSGYNSRDLAYYAFPAPGYMPYNNNQLGV